MSGADSARCGVVDAHHHLWDLSRRRQPWLDEPAHQALRRSFCARDLRADATRSIAGLRLTTTVVVQCIQSVPETRDLLAVADDDPLIGAVVGWADLADPAVGDILDELTAGPGGAHLRSLRHLVQDEPDPAWLQRPEVERGLKHLSRRGLSYDVLIRSHQFGQATRLAERHPDLPLALDHAGKPPVVGRDLKEWERHVRRLAVHEQVMCKVSGLITEADPEHWSISDIRPVWEVLLDAFGPQRLMFGSDWPVCRVAGGWNVWAATVDELLTGCSFHEARAVLHDTASTFYRLRPDEHGKACAAPRS